MGNKHKPTYMWAKHYTRDKDTAINTYIDTMLDRTQAMFVWDGLPESIPQTALEGLLQTKGHICVAEVEGALYALSGGYSGQTDAYGRPKQYTVSNAALNLSKTYDINQDCIIVRNDYKELGLLPVLAKYGALLCDTEISLNTVAIMSRVTMLLSAPDDRTKKSAELFISRILDGDYSVIGENQFFDGVRLQNASHDIAITQLIELIQYYRATAYNSIGLLANYNMKREKLTATESAMSIDALLPLVDNMFSCRAEAADKINNMFGTDITVAYGSSWATTQAQDIQSKQAAQSVINPTAPDVTGVIDTADIIDESSIEEENNENSNTASEKSVTDEEDESSIEEENNENSNTASEKSVTDEDEDEEEDESNRKKKGGK